MLLRPAAAISTSSIWISRLPVKFQSLMLSHQDLPEGVQLSHRFQAPGGKEMFVIPLINHESLEPVMQ